MKLEGKTALVTGSTRGIGRAIAERFAREGAHVWVNGRTAEACEQAAAAIAGAGGKATPGPADLGSLDQIAALTEKINVGGGCDIVVNNAAITAGVTIAGMTPEEWDRVMNANLKGMFFLTRALIPKMAERGGGAVVNLSSIYAWGAKGQIHYDVSKGAIISMTRSMAVELGKHNIRVNCISPGFIETDMAAGVPKAVLQAGLMMSIIRRPGRPEEIASAALFLATDESSYITGETLQVNGGLLRA